jgi:ubiquinone/menaquinone biosynthesis C-methylase UbiE
MPENVLRDTFLDPAASLRRARETAMAIGASTDYAAFVAGVRKMYPGLSERPATVVDRDYLRIVDHHLEHLLPELLRYVRPDAHRVLDFGCGSGGSAIALAMVHPEVYCIGTDLDEGAIEVAKRRARLYGVEDRCEFHLVGEGAPLPLADNSFDFSLCSSVLEYCTEPPIRKFCVEEMVRLVKPEGLLFFSVPNRIYPFEIHTRKWGWNYFPKWFNAGTVDCTFWEVRKLARPAELKLYRTPLVKLVRPWTNFCVKRGA